MKTISFIVCLVSTIAFNSSAHASLISAQVSNSTEAQSAADMVDFDPNAADAEQVLEMYDKYIEQTTGESTWINEKPQAGMEFLMEVGGCYRTSCPVYAHVNKASQTMTLYVSGRAVGQYATSTGVGGRTPNFDKHPDGRVYQRYTSNKYPGGDYSGLGNMPYAVFISGGFAIHGTPSGNWRRLGSPASHGCIRIHPDNARYFNGLVRQYGSRNVWITVN